MDETKRFPKECRTNNNSISRLLSNWKDGSYRVKIITTNGFQMKGMIVDEDEERILFDERDRYGKEIIIYKHAISTIMSI